MATPADAAATMTHASLAIGRIRRLAITRTAMCAEPRDGVLYMFMPPTEAARGLPGAGRGSRRRSAEALSQPVMLEGYEPPSDPRLNSFRVTPDPGVIEVNIHPSASWDELVERTRAPLRSRARVAAHRPRNS